MTVLFRRLAPLIAFPLSPRGGCHLKVKTLSFQPTVNNPRIASGARRMASSDSNTPGGMFSIDQLLCFTGTWKGEGKVLNSTGDTVATYMEQAEFKPVRKTDAFVVYRHTQETQHAVKNVPMHTETGFLKLLTDGTAVASFAHPFPSGFIDEMSEGSLETTGKGKSLTLTAKDFQRAVPNPTNGKKQVQGFQRVYALEDGKLSYKQYLSTKEGGDNRYHHLSCSFTKKQE